MRFLADDGKFGLLISPVAGSGMFRFQLIIDSTLVGDCDPCIIGSAMHQLKNISVVSDLGLDPTVDNPSIVAEILSADEKIHDSIVHSMAESLDDWLILALAYAGKFIMIAKKCRNTGPGESAVRSVVDLEEYSSLISVACDYWRSFLQ